MKKSRTSLFTYQLALLTFCILFFSCSDKSTNPQPEPYGPDKVVYDVEYNDNVIIIDEEKKKSLVSYDTTDWTRFEFDPAGLGEWPKEGDIMIVQGLALVKVLSVQNITNSVIIESEPAKLTDAIKNGRIYWDFTPKIDASTIIEAEGKELNTHIAGKFEYEFEWGNNTYKIVVDPEGQSEEGLPELQVNLSIANYESKDGKLSGGYGANGSVRLPRQTTNIEIEESNLSDFNTSNKGSRCELTLQYVAEFSPGGGKFALTMPNIVMKIPIQSLTTIPIPIPMYIKIGIGFYSYINVPSVTASATAKIKLVLDSDTGFQFTGPSVELAGKVNDHELGDFQDWAIGDFAMQPVPVEIQHDVSIPRIGLEIAGQEVSWASLVFSSRSKFMVPSLCKAAFGQVRIDGGYKLEVLGQTIAEDSKVFWEVGKEIKGPGCD